MLNIKKLYLNLFILNCMFILSGAGPAPLKHARATSGQVRRLFASHDRHYATAGAIITDTCWLLIKHLLIGGRPTGRIYTIAIARSFSDQLGTVSIDSSLDLLLVCLFFFLWGGGGGGGDFVSWYRDIPMYLVRLRWRPLRYMLLHIYIYIQILDYYVLVFIIPLIFPSPKPRALHCTVLIKLKLTPSFIKSSTSRLVVPDSTQ